MFKARISKTIVSLAVFGGLSLAFSGLASADYGAPAPSSCSKYKKGSKEWKQCMGQLKPDQNGDVSERFAYGYWLAKTGDYEKALVVLKGLPDQNDVGVLTMIGFATRHIGRVEEALGYYEKALAHNPNLTNTRQYLGEAYLQMRDLERAKGELGEIARICGNAVCEDYVKLAKEISLYEAKG